MLRLHDPRAALLGTLGLLLGCPAQPSAAPGLRTTPAVAAAPTAGFVIYTEEQTTVVPVDPSVEVGVAFGYWLAQRDDPRHIERFTGKPSDAPAGWGLLECACKNGCSDVSQTIEMGAGTIASDCPCFVGAGSADEEHPEHPESAYRSGRVQCLVPSEGIGAHVSVAGARIYGTSSGSSMTDECGFDTGYNVYDSYGADAELVRGAPPAPEVNRASWQICLDYIDGASVLDLVNNNYDCRMDGQADPALSPPGEGEDEGENPEDANDEDEDEDGMSGYYDACDEGCQEADAPYPVVRSSHLCWIAESTSAVGMESHAASCQPLNADNCPSSYDPCGPVDRFRFLVGSDPWDTAHWVSSDGRYALIDQEVYGPETDEDGSPALVRTHDAAPQEILGVLFLPDVQPLLASMRRFGEDTPAIGQVPIPCDEETPCPGLMRCHPDGSCYAPCAEDDDCSGAGFCGAACEDGVCSATPTSDCTETACAHGYLCLEDDSTIGGLEGACVDCTRHEHCGPGGLCDAGRCDACEVDDECASGSCELHRCVPSECPQRSASSLGNACFSALRAAPDGDGEDDALAAAMHLCECALTRSPADATRGAILYNIGRILERWGAHQSAIWAYEQSLRARPGNEATRQRQSRLR